MNIILHTMPECPVCGAEVPVFPDRKIVSCNHCNKFLIPEFIQQAQVQNKDLEQLNNSLNQLRQELAEARNEAARTGGATASALKRELEKRYHQLSDELCTQYERYKSSQAFQLNELFRKAQEDQHCRRFSFAISHYQKMLESVESPLDRTEIHWQIVMCRYGVEYVFDTYSKTYIPTLTLWDSSDLKNDLDYQAVCRLSKAPNSLYSAEEESLRAQYIQRGETLISLISQYSNLREEFDVFISVKQVSDEGIATEDKKVAQELYDRLQAQGLNVFYSAKTLLNHTGHSFEPCIMRALLTSKVMIVIASCEKYLEARWIQNEWRRFRQLHENAFLYGQRPLIIYSIKKGDTLMLPASLAGLQIIDEQFVPNALNQACEIIHQFAPSKIPSEPPKEVSSHLQPPPPVINSGGTTIINYFGSGQGQSFFPENIRQPLNIEVIGGYPTNTNSPLQHAPLPVSEVPHGSDNAAPHNSDNATPRKSDNAAPRKSDNAAPRNSDNAAPRNSDNAAPHKSDNAAPRKSDNAAPHKSDNAVSRNSDSHPSPATEFPSSVEELTQQIHFMYFKGLYEQAIECYNQLSPSAHNSAAATDSELTSKVADCHFILASRSYQSLSADDPQYVPKLQEIFNHYIQADRLKGSISTKLLPALIGCCCRLGDIYSQQKRSSQAIDCYTIAVNYVSIFGTNAQKNSLCQKCTGHLNNSSNSGRMSDQWKALIAKLSCPTRPSPRRNRF